MANAIPLKLTRNTYLHGALVGPPQVISVDAETARNLIARGYAEAVAGESLREQPKFEPVAHQASPVVVVQPKKKR